MIEEEFSPCVAPSPPVSPPVDFFEEMMEISVAPLASLAPAPVVDIVAPLASLAPAPVVDIEDKRS